MGTNNINIVIFMASSWLNDKVEASIKHMPTDKPGNIFINLTCALQTYHNQLEKWCESKNMLQTHTATFVVLFESAGW